ncbi:MAG TPA: hypothetical protein PLD86_11375 [Vicinamibacteria bacterium]|nr:hypothetical protein [Vicinamibacteria bacterium]
MRRTSLSVIGIVAVLSLPALARAQEGAPSPIKGRWTLSFRGGLDLPLSGDVHGGGTGAVLALPTTVQAKSYGDIYGTAPRGEAQFGYGVSERVELFASGSYAKESAEVQQVGTVAGLALNAEFAEYEEVGLEGGMRYFFKPQAMLKPYFGLSAGVRFLETNSPSFTVPAAQVTLADVPFYDSSTVATAAAVLGMRYDVSPTFSLGLETGPRYQGKPDNLPTLTGSGLESINDTGDRWTMPILFTATLRF